MRFVRVLVPVLAILGSALAALPVPASAADDWSMNTTVIEACSCPVFCQCYFNPKPSGHGGSGGHDAEHFCRFNNAYKVNKGHWGKTSLDGVLFWISGDLGDDFSDAEMDWAVVTFDKSASPAQREAINKIVPHLFPVKWKAVSTAEHRRGDDQLDGGQERGPRAPRRRQDGRGQAQPLPGHDR